MPIIDDGTVEGTEVFTGRLTSSQEQVMLINSTMNITILDDDKIGVRFDQVEYSVNEEDSVVTLRVRKEGRNEIPIDLIVSTEGGNATSKS